MSNVELFGGRAVMSFRRLQDRRHFLRWAALLGVGGSLAVSVSERLATAQGGGDVDILNFALTLEHLERDFFRRGLDAGVLSGRERDLVAAIAAHEQTHVTVIASAVDELGGTPAPEPELRYPSGTFADRQSFLSTASTLEDVGVAAYQGQVTRLQTPEILAAAGAIAGTESRHAAILRRLIDEDPFPDPIETAKTRPQVLRIADPFLRG